MLVIKQLLFGVYILVFSTTKLLLVLTQFLYKYNKAVITYANKIDVSSVKEFIIKYLMLVLGESFAMLKTFFRWATSPIQI